VKMENFSHFEVAKSNFVNTPKNSSPSSTLSSSPLFAFFSFISFLVWFTYSIKFSTWHNCRRLKVFLTPLFASKWDSDGERNLARASELSEGSGAGVGLDSMGTWNVELWVCLWIVSTSYEAYWDLL
jgi:hypothetical protein